MPLYLVVHHRDRYDGRGGQWGNRWLDEWRLEAITTTAEIGELCEEARENDERVYVHRCRWRDGGYRRPVVCCSVKVVNVFSEEGDTRVTFKDAERLPDVRPLYSPRRGESYYRLDDLPAADTFQRGWEEARGGEVQPADRLWDGIEAR